MEAGKRFAEPFTINYKGVVNRPFYFL